MSDLREKLEKWAYNLHHTDLIDGAEKMLDLLWPVLAAALSHDYEYDDPEKLEEKMEKALAELEKTL